MWSIYTGAKNISKDQIINNVRIFVQKGDATQKHSIPGLHTNMSTKGTGAYFYEC